MNVLGVITARGGSKGIPRKNLKLLGGRPLIAHTIVSARESGAFDRVIVSTDDPEIADAARGLGGDVPFLRPADLARDDTPHLPVMQHAVGWLADREQYRPDLVVILQPTSPFRRPEDIRESLALLARTDADSVVSVSAVPAHYNPMRTLRVDDRGRATLFVTGQPLRTRINRRQDMPAAWTMNGAIYAFQSSLLFEHEPSLYGDTTATYAMWPPFDISLDDLNDWAEAERAHELLGQEHHGH